MPDVSVQNLEAFIGIVGEAIQVFAETTADLEARQAALTSLETDAAAQLDRVDDDLAAARASYDGAVEDATEALDALREGARAVGHTDVPAAAEALREEGSAFGETVKAGLADLDEDLSGAREAFETLGSSLDESQERLDAARRALETAFTLVEAGLRGLEESLESEIHDIEQRLEASTDGTDRRRDRMGTAQEGAEDEREGAAEEWATQCETLETDLGAACDTAEAEARDAAGKLVELLRALVVDGLGEPVVEWFEEKVEGPVTETLEEVDAAAARLEGLRELLSTDRELVKRWLELSIELGKARQVEAKVAQLLEALN
jgi:hypothetical protein